MTQTSSYFCEDHFDEISDNILLQITISAADLCIKFSTYYESDASYFRLCWHLMLRHSLLTLHKQIPIWDSVSRNLSLVEYNCLLWWIQSPLLWTQLFINERITEIREIFLHNTDWHGLFHLFSILWRRAALIGVLSHVIMNNIYSTFN